MKPFILFILLAVGPLVAIGSDVTPPAAAASNTTEKAAVKSETNLESLQQHSPTTDSTASKDNFLHSKYKPVAPLPKNPDIAPFLHRIPVFENRNPLVETISKLESQLKQSAPEPKATAATDNSSSSGTELELPIPSRCPQITGTAESERNKDDWVQLLDAKSKPKAAQRGCRFFILNELMDRSRLSATHSTPEEQLNQTLENCLKSCTQAYNGTDVCDACYDGCRKTAQVTQAAKKALSGHDNDELEREDESEHGGNMHRTFSIIIPLRPIESDEESKDMPANQGSDAFPSMMPNAIKMMLQMMHQMTERARLAMMQRAQDQSPLNGNGNIQESETSIDQSGNSISVSRSMSVLMTKDKDGHSKMLVVHTLPKIQIHRFGQNPFGSDEDDDLISIPRDPSSSNHETEDDDDDELTDMKLFGQLSNGHHRGNSHQTKDGHSLKEVESTQVYFYRSRLCYYLPRLFYLTLIILILYVVFWLFCAVPTALYARNNRRPSSDSGVAIIASGINGDGKRKKFFFTKNARYFALNNKRNSTTSLPPPYPGTDDATNGGSCAEPLPEKQPLPEGGLEIKLASDNK